MKVTAAKPLPDFRLRLQFADGTDRVVDLSYLDGVFLGFLGAVLGY
jgi:hypothetical protein